MRFSLVQTGSEAHHAIGNWGCFFQVQSGRTVKLTILRCLISVLIKLDEGHEKRINKEISRVQ
jgi:hypothetical protein